MLRKAGIALFCLTVGPMLWLVSPAYAADVVVPAAAETEPVPSSLDAADDTAIWIHPTDPSKSVVIGTDKLATGGVGVYDLAGNELHFYLDGSLNNVDLRYNFPLGSERVSLVGVTDRNDTSTGVQFYKVNVADRSLTKVGHIDTSGRPRGFGMYHSPVSGKYYAFVHDFHTNEIFQYALDGSTGSVTGTLVRSFDNGDTSEGIVADDELQALYVSEEDVALWKYGAEPGAGSARTAVDRVTTAGGHLQANIKNPSIYYGRNHTGYLIVSSQGGSNFHVYTRADNTYIGSFKIGSGLGVDSVSGQDGIEVTNFGLGPAFPGGLFTSQDHNNTDAGNGNSGNQNYKYASWQTIASSFTPNLLVDPLFDPRQIGADGGGGTPPPDDTIAPETTLDSGPSGTTGSTSASFTFSANEPSTFECRLDTASFTTCASPTSYTGLAAGSHTFQVRATDTSGNVDLTPAGRTWTVDTSASSTLTFVAQADATVQGASPDTNYGNAITLGADNSPQEESYLRFDVSGVDGSVERAVLRLYVTNGSTNGPAVYGTSSSWSETGITWNTGRPTRTSGVLEDKGSISSGAYVEYDVTSFVTGNGLTSFDVAPTSSDGTDMSSREAASNRPQLVVTGSGAAPPPPTDDVPPTVTSASPADGATGVVTTTTVRATFSESVQAGTVSDASVHLRPSGTTTDVAATVGYDSGTRTATLTPSSPLAAGTTYVARVDQTVKDLAGNAMTAAYVWEFTTASVEPPPPPQGQIARESTATVQNNTATTSVTVPRPAGTAAGDVLVACVTTNGANVSASGVPAGWTSLAAVTSVSNPRVFGYYRVAGPSEPTAYTWTLGGSVANSGGIARYSGVDTDTALDAPPSSASGPASTTARIPGVTTTSPGAMVVGCVGANSSSTSLTIAAPTEMTGLWDLAGKRQRAADTLQPVAGPSGPKDWTLSASRAWAGWLVALRPRP